MHAYTPTKGPCSKPACATHTHMYHGRSTGIVAGFALSAVSSVATCTTVARSHPRMRGSRGAGHAMLNTLCTCLYRVQTSYAAAWLQATAVVSLVRQAVQQALSTVVIMVHRCCMDGTQATCSSTHYVPSTHDLHSVYAL